MAGLYLLILFVTCLANVDVIDASRLLSRLRLKTLTPATKVNSESEFRILAGQHTIIDEETLAKKDDMGKLESFGQDNAELRHTKKTFYEYINPFTPNSNKGKQKKITISIKIRSLLNAKKRSSMLPSDWRFSQIKLSIPCGIGFYVDDESKYYRLTLCGISLDDRNRGWIDTTK